VLTLALLTPVVVLGLLVAMAAFERRVLGQTQRRTSPQPDGRERPGTRADQ